MKSKLKLTALALALTIGAGTNAFAVLELDNAAAQPIFALGVPLTIFYPDTHHSAEFMANVFGIHDNMSKKEIINAQDKFWAVFKAKNFSYSDMELMNRSLKKHAAPGVCSSVANLC